MYFLHVAGRWYNQAFSLLIGGLNATGSIKAISVFYFYAQLIY